MKIKYGSKLLVIAFMASVMVVPNAYSAKKMVANPLLGIIKKNFDYRPPHHWQKDAKVEEGSWCNWLGVTCGGNSGVAIAQLQLPIDGGGVLDLQGLDEVAIVNISGAASCGQLKAWQKPKGACTDTPVFSSFIGVKNGKGLKHLYASYSRMRGSIDLNALGLNNLLTIDVDFTLVTNVVNGPYLENYDAVYSAARGQVDVSTLPSLRYLDFSHTAITGITNAKSVIDLKVRYASALTGLDLRPMQRLRNFDAEGSGLNQLILSRTLVNVHVPLTKIQGIDLSTAENLITINLSGCEWLTSLVVGSGMAKLRDINFAGTKLAVLDLSYCKTGFNLNISNMTNLATINGLDYLQNVKAENTPGFLPSVLGYGVVLDLGSMPRLRTIEPPSKRATIERIKADRTDQCTYFRGVFGESKSKVFCTAGRVWNMVPTEAVRAKFKCVKGGFCTE